MALNKLKKPIILGILFLLPVTFLIFLYPSTHNYNTLDIIKGDVLELNDFTSYNNDVIKLEENITVLGFLGKTPNEEALTALNLKELIYDKFKGFKRFQVVMIVPFSAKDEVELLEKELYQYDELKYWRFAYGDSKSINNVFNSLRTETDLDVNLFSQSVFIVDKERNQRGRIDDREKKEKERNIPVKGLFDYDCIEVSILKNKMSEDIRILFTEYRQKRKGDFNSSVRRANDIKTNEKD